MGWAKVFLALVVAGWLTPPLEAQTKVGIDGTKFTINGQVTYTPASGFPQANKSVEGPLLNVRAVQAIFDDANYPNGGSKQHPYNSPGFEPVAFDYPDALSTRSAI